MTTNELIETLDGLDDDGIRTIAEKAKTLQRHIDRRVNGAIAKAKETPAEPTLEDREAALTRREGIASLAIEKGIAPSTAMALLGMGEDSSDAERLDMIVEYTEATETRVKDQILRDHVRNPRVSELSTETPDEYVLEHPEQFPADITTAALDRSMAKDREKRTLRHVMGGR